MENLIIAQASKSLDIFKQELVNNSQNSAISIQFQHIRQQSKEYLDFLADHLINQQHYYDFQIRIIKKTILGDEGYQILANSLKRQSKVQILKLYFEKSCYIGSFGLLYLSEALQNLKELYDLTIFIDQNNYIRNDGLKYLARVFPQLQNLKKLSIQISQPNRYDQTGVIAIYEGIKHLKVLTNLELQIGSTNISKLEVESIAQTLESLTNLQILDLKINHELGQIEGIKNLAYALGQLVDLRQLKFSASQQNCSEIEVEFSNSLKNLKKLEIFQIDGFKFYDQQSIISFADIFSQFSQLRKLSLQINSSKINGQHAIICLSNSLKSIGNLSDFEIMIQDSCNIGVEGSSALAQAIKTMENLTKLHMCINRNNKIGCKGAISIGEALGELKQLKFLKLYLGSYNHLKNEGASTLIQGAQQISSLVELDVKICNNNQFNMLKINQNLANLNNLQVLNYDFSDNGITFCSLGLQNLKNLKQLQFQFFDFINVTDESLKLFFESFQYLKNLQSLKIIRSISEYFRHFLYLENGIKYLENLIDLQLLIGRIEDDKSQNYINFGKTLCSLTKLTKLNLQLSFLKQTENNQALEYFKEIANGVKSLILIQDLKINFYNIKIDFDQSQLFTEMIKKLINLKNLNVSFNQVDYNSLEHIGSSFQFLPDLESIHLELKFNENQVISNQTAISFGKLFTHLRNLKNLYILIYIADEEVNFDYLIQEIKNLKSIQKIKGKISQKNGQTINFLQCINSFNDIQNVDLDLRGYMQNNRFIENQISSTENKIEDQLFINEQLENCLSLTSLKLVIGQNNIDVLNNFLINIIKYVNINKLHLKIENSISFSTVQSQLMSKSLINFQKLNELTLIFQENNGFQTQAAKHLGNALKNLPELEYLNLTIGKFNHINSQGAHYLAQGLVVLINLKQLKLTLRDCNILRQGAIYLGDSLSYLISLKILSLVIEEDQIESNGAISIGRSFQFLTNLTDLNVNIGKNNQIMQAGAYGLGFGMENLINLTILDLTFSHTNNIQSRGVSSICKAISKMKYLQCLILQFDDNQIESTCIQEISQAIKNLEYLQKFYLEIYVSLFTSNYNFEIIDLIRLMDTTAVNFSYENQDYESQIIHEIESVATKDHIYNHQITIITDNDLEKIFQNFFLPIQSISQIPEITILKLKMPNSVYLDQETCLKLGEYLQHLKNIEYLQIDFNFCIVKAGIIEILSGLSKLNNINHLNLQFHWNNDISGFHIQQIGIYINQLKNLESFELLLERQNDLVFSDLIALIKQILSLQKLRSIKIDQDLWEREIDAYLIINMLQRKIKRLVQCQVENIFYD